LTHSRQGPEYINIFIVRKIWKFERSNKMRRRLAILMGLATVFATWAPSYGAYPSRISSGLSAEADAYAKDSTGSAGPEESGT
jgi:hypothetical protein